MSPEEQIHKLAAFPRTNPNPVLELAADGAMTYCNDAARQLAASFGADSPAAILPPGTKALIGDCLSTGENIMNLQTKMQQRTLSWSFIPVVESKLVHCYATDITERLNLEAQLRYSVKMEAVGQLAAGVAHDFNNILTIIQGHADLLHQFPGLPAACEKSARQIAAAAERASQLIKQLLMFSRKQVMQQRCFDLNEIIQNLSPMLRGLAGEHINFLFDAAPNLPALYLDVGMIEQVLVNLVLNARDAMRSGGQLTLSTSQQTLEPVSSVLNPEARPGHFVCLKVADSGCGMDAQTLSHLFEPFFTTKGPGKGTGLGLATVYGIVKQHQGWVVVDSQVGVGSIFTLFFPSAAIPANAVTRAPVQEQGMAQGPPVLARGDETILVVEDEPALRELVVNILELCGYRICQARTGVEALGVWERHKGEIDLLLTDMVMPEGMSGRQLAERLQAERPGLKVIYTSGYSPGMAGKDIALLEGFNFLAKPYPPSRLAQVVRECLDGKRGPAAGKK
ncbi:MAG: ATP-binding protein [Verrucomicrobiota bacterium]|jgi:signal transduction histidine kinase/ActR/RegA family two-component response regulator